MRKVKRESGEMNLRDLLSLQPLPELARETLKRPRAARDEIKRGALHNKAPYVVVIIINAHCSL
jgi:hypothetical protein